MKRRILLTFLFLILPLSFNACGAGEFPEAEGTLEPSPLVSISGGGDAGSAASPVPSPIPTETAPLASAALPAFATPAAETSATEEPEPAESAPPEPGQEDSVILRIGGDAVDGETGYSLVELQAMREGYAEETYSELSGWPSASFTAAKGVRLDWLLQQSGIGDDAGVILVTAADGTAVSFTRDQLLGEQYLFPGIQDGDNEDAVSVPPMLAWACRENSGDLSQTEPLAGLRLMLGQTGIHNANETVSLADVVSIQVTTEAPGRWDSPRFSVAGGLVCILHDSMDDVKIYYTTDGSEPGEDSCVYNPSAGNLQPDLNAPFSVEPGTTVCAIAVGYGRYDSAMAEFIYVE